jgi:hypothetical protein
MMSKKTVLILFIFTISCFTIFGQKNTSILSAPDNWRSEIIPFPMRFAPSIDFVGYEDIRFAPGWNDAKSEEFWTYSFVWYIEKYGTISESKLTETFSAYYDGLMRVVQKNKIDTTSLNKINKTICLFIKTNEGFSGKIRTYDAFFSKNYITLNIKIKEDVCPESNKQIIFCNISPKDFEHEVWKIFDDVKLDVKCD